MSTQKNGFLICSALVFATFSTPLFAATNPAAIETLVITAKRKPEQRLNLASNINVIEQGTIQENQAVHINQLSTHSPGVWISRGNGQENLTAIRSGVLTGPASCGAFVFAEDSIPLRGQGFCNANQLFGSHFQQARQIEIVRGPSSAGYGSNALQGVINVLTPKVGQAGSYLQASGGPDDYQTFSFSRDSRDGQGLLVQGFASHDNGYQDNSAYAQQKLLLKHHNKNLNKTTTSALALNNLNQETAGLITGYKAYENSDLRRQNPNPEAFRDARSLRAYQRHTTHLETGADIVITPYLRSHTMRFAQHWLPWAPIEENQHSSLGLRSALQNVQASDYRWSSGFDIEYSDAKLQEYQNSPTSISGFSGEVRPQGHHYDYQIKSLVLSSFAQTEISITPKHEIHTGIRLTHTRYDYENRLSDGKACAASVSDNDCRYYRPSDRLHKFDDLSFDIAYLYKYSSSSSAWLKLAQAFRAPETTELFRLQRGQKNTGFDSEKMQGIELGWRTLTKRWQFEMSLYWQQKSDVILQNSATKTFIGQGRTEHKGLEIQNTLALSDSLSWLSTLAISKHTYASDLAISNQNIKGNDIDTAPRQTASTQLRWQVSEPFNAAVELLHLSRYYLDAENLHRYDGHTLANLRLHYQLNPHFKLSLIIYNIADIDYAERADFGFGNYRYSVGQERSSYIRLRYDF